MSNLLAIISNYEDAVGSPELTESQKASLYALVDEAGSFATFAHNQLQLAEQSVEDAQVEGRMFSMKYFACAGLLAAILDGQVEFIPVFIDICAEEA